jgi:hypothetical protein
LGGGFGRGWRTCLEFMSCMDGSSGFARGLGISGV